MRGLAMVLLAAAALGPACDGTSDRAEDAAVEVDADADAGVDAGEDADVEADAEPTPCELFLRGATIITATGAPPLVGQGLCVAEGRIARIEPEPADLPGDAEVLDLDGLTLLPGFVDAHVHLAGRRNELREPLDLMIEFGVTTVRDVGSPLDRILDLADAVESGWVVGPRVLAAGPAFTAPAGHPIATMYGSDTWMIENATRAPTSPEQAREQVRELAEAGVDLVKCVLTDCAGTAAEACERLALPILAAIVDEAHGQGLGVAVHTDSLEDIAGSLDAGADSIEHGATVDLLTPELAARLAAEGVFTVPTVSVVSLYGGLTLDEILGNLSALREAGAPVAVGTDALNSGADWGASFHEELIFLVRAGWTEMEALVAATRVGSELLGLSEQIGTIEEGKVADLVAVAGDPLEDLSVVEDVRLVVLGGVVARWVEE